MTVMTSGMAHISGGIMAAYISFGIEAKHLLTAVIMTGARHDHDGEDARARDRKCRRRWGRSSWKWSGPTSTSSTQRAAAPARDCTWR
jgi:hypothetical protein